MRKHIVAVATTLAAGLVAASSVPTVALAQSSARRPDVVGVWRMDTTKFHKHDAALSSLTLTVSRRGDTLLIVTDALDTSGPPMQMRARYLPEQYLGAIEPADAALRASPLSWAGDTLVLHHVEQRPDRTLKIDERWTLDASGHTLSRLQTVADGPHLSRQTLVFTRE